MANPHPSDASDADPLLTLSGRKGLTWRTFPVPEARVLFVQINKNACTSLKWLIAGIAGEDLAGFGPSAEAAVAAEDDIHDRRQWKKSPRLDQLIPEVRRAIHPDNGWFVFAVVRDPRSRLFSAWQSKLLLDNPGYTSFRSEPWYPRHPATVETIVEDFAKFVDLFERDPEYRIRRDGHFRDQVEMLHEDLVAYTKIYDIREMGVLLTDLREHLDRVGWTGELDLPRFNDTPLRPNAQPFANGVGERIEKIYSADFDRFGERWDFAKIASVPEWTESDLREVELRAEFGRRFGSLRHHTVGLQTQLAAARKSAAANQARAERIEKLVPGATSADPWRAHLRSDLRRVADTVRRRRPRP